MSPADRALREETARIEHALRTGQDVVTLSEATAQIALATMRARHARAACNAMDRLGRDWCTTEEVEAELLRAEAP